MRPCPAQRGRLSPAALGSAANILTAHPEPRHTRPAPTASGERGHAAGRGDGRLPHQRESAVGTTRRRSHVARDVRRGPGACGRRHVAGTGHVHPTRWPSAGGQTRQLAGNRRGAAGAEHGAVRGDRRRRSGRGSPRPPHIENLLHASGIASACWLGHDLQGGIASLSAQDRHLDRLAESLSERSADVPSA